MLKSKRKTYKDIDEYTDYLIERTGIPHTNHVLQGKLPTADGMMTIDILPYHRDAPTIIFIPGTAIYSMPFIPFINRFRERGYNVIGMDPIGHGRSEGKRGDYTMQQLMENVEIVVAFAKQRFSSRVSLFGSSQGGMVAFYLAAKGIAIDSAICHCIADLGLADNVKLTRYPTLFRMLKPLFITAADKLPSIPLPVKFYLDLKKLRLKHLGSIEHFIDNDPYALHYISTKALASLSYFPLPCPVEEIKTPVMAFMGAEDEVFPVSYVEKIFSKLRCKKQLRIFEGMGHCCFSNYPDVIYPALEEWLAGIYENEEL